MTRIASLLKSSRRLHAAAKTKQGAEAKELFAAAKADRETAAIEDDAFSDPEWLEDARVVNGAAGQYHRVPGKSRAEVAQAAHVALLQYFADQIAKL